jgi:vancomycin resistance protein VanJ
VARRGQRTLAGAVARRQGAAHTSTNWVLGGARVLLGLLALAYLGSWIGYGGLLALGLTQTGWPSLVRELTLYLFVPLVPLLLAALALRAVFAIVCLAPVAALFLTLYGGRLLPPVVRGASAGADGFTVLTFNAGGNAGGGRPAPLLRAVQVVAADLVALQEVPPDTRPIVRAELAARYPYMATHADAPDLLVLSRFPLGAGEALPLRQGAFDGFQVRIDIAGRPVQLVNLHLARPGYRLRWRGGLVPTVRAFDPRQRDAQVAELVGYLGTLAQPRLVVGDFNASEWSHTHALLARELHDSFAAAGWGFGHTYPSHVVWGSWEASVPLLRIDYVFHSGELVALHAAVGPDGGSDHLPVAARLAFR